MQKLTIILIFIEIFYCTASAQTFPVNAIMENGPVDKRINMIFLGDGYRITEMGKYRQDVQATVNSIFNQSPYKEYKYLFNIYAIDVPSNESGTNHPGTASDCGSLKDSVFSRDTYFNCSFDVSGIHRLLVPNNYTKINQVLMNNFPEYDVVLMVVNHTWYGGSGGSVAAFSTNISSSEIAIHETGHSFAQLDDEYDYGYSNPVQVEGYNVTCRTSRDSIIWNPWILQSTPIPTPANSTYSSVIGLFEGAYYSSKYIYRPKLNCKMRTLSVPFCQVCAEQHVRSYFGLVNIIDDHFPNSDTVTINTNNGTSFNIALLKLLSGVTTVDWLLDNNSIAQDTNSIYLSGSGLSVSNHFLKAKVKHTTPFVINDPEKLLEDNVEWIVKVLNPNGVENTGIIPKECVLNQNYPNPFNPNTVISYSIPSGSMVKLNVYNTLGQTVKVLERGFKDSGNYSITFDASNLPNGIYFYRLDAGRFSQIKKMVLIK